MTVVRLSLVAFGSSASRDMVCKVSAGLSQSMFEAIGSQLCRIAHVLRHVSL